jgi:hypothetical protein
MRAVVDGKSCSPSGGQSAQKTPRRWYVAGNDTAVAPRATTLPKHSTIGGAKHEGRWRPYSFCWLMKNLSSQLNLVVTCKMLCSAG